MQTRGFTVVEVVVAMLVLLTGLAALAGSSALVSRQLGRSRSIGRATEMAVRRVEVLRAAASRRASPAGARCQHPSFASGTDSAPGMREAWTVAASGGLRTASVVVTYARVGGASQVALHTLIACY
jgi:Tfp pilus assembly protein PilV